MTASMPPRRPSVVPVAPRQRARAAVERRTRRTRLVRRAGWVGLTLLPLGVLGWLLTSSPLLQVDDVEVVGTGSPAAVLDAAAVQPGSALLGVDVEGVRSRVLALPAVAGVEVVRDWPGTLRLEVADRVPVAFVTPPGGQRRLVDATGTAFADTAAPPPGVVELVVPAPGPSPGDPTTTAALSVLIELPEPLRSQVATLQGRTPQSVQLVLRDGRSVVWGAPGGTAEKAAVVLALTGKPGEEVDVTRPGLAVVRGTGA